MTFKEALKMERNKRKWIERSKNLFRKYDKLDMFDYEWGYYYDSLCWYGDDHITVGGNHNDPKTYYVADSKEGYKHLKLMLELEIKIRYNNENDID